MAGLHDSVSDLERYRLLLEENLAKLRASLRHWQTWELEYEEMKEEVEGLETGQAMVELVTLHNGIESFTLADVPEGKS